MNAGSRSTAKTIREHVLAPLSDRFAGRTELVELAGLAIAAGENLLVVGPPGTAKSELISELARRVGGRYFEYLLTRFTEPAEIFGPVDIRQLRRGEVITRTEGMLPEAEIVFLDEIFNAGSAILNTLLGVLNEGVYRHGATRGRTPLLSAFAATNSLSKDPTLRALEDRFALRIELDIVADDQLGSLIERGWRLEQDKIARDAVRQEVGETSRSSEHTAEPTVSIDELRELQRLIASCDLEAVHRPLEAIVRRARSAGLFLSDRRIVKLLRLAAASAILCGRDRAAPSDLWPVRYAWERREDREPLADISESVIDETERAATPTAPHEEAVHPLARRGSRPSELLEQLDLLENAVGELAAPIQPARADELHNRLQHLASERRWCRARSQGEESQLREFGERLASLTSHLVEKEEAR